MDTPLSLRLPKTAAKKLGDAGFHTVRDLLYYPPLRYYQWGKLTPIGQLEEGEHATILARVVSANLVKNRSGAGVRLVVVVTDDQSRLSCTFFAKNAYMLSHHQRLLRPGATVLLSGKVSEYRGSTQMVQPEFEEVEEGSAEDAARRAGRPIPIYRTIGGLPSWKIAALIGGLLDEALADTAEQGVVPTELRQQHALFDHWHALRMLHQPQTPVDWQTARRTLAWEEALVLQTTLLAARESRQGGAVALEADGMVDQLLRALPFRLTGAQQSAWEQIEAELGGQEPMQRLLQGDVGSGKTVVALMAMLRAVESGYQATLLAPTEVLARQHWQSLTNMLDSAGIDVPVHLLTSKRAAAEKNQVLASLASGEPSIVVGTHALLQDAVELPRLALVVVDEQHRFGVAQREQLRQGRDPLPHLLVMTATPIPRTIAMTVFGDLDVTAMAQMPQGRRPVSTFLVNQGNRAWVERMWQRAREEVDGGGRVYVVCPRIEASEDEEPPGGEPVATAGPATVFDDVVPPPGGPSRPLPPSKAPGGSVPGNGPVGAPPLPAAEEVVEELRGMEVFQGIEIGLAHGRLKPEENARAFQAFASGNSPVLVATTVVEVGVDVPEATMMVILDGTRFGLSQLHQLRGRVGRSDRPSVCMITHPAELAPATQERLEAIAGTTDGFVLAETDLRLRREGDVLGKSQSGRFSGLQFLSVRRDSALISAARKAARLILDRDPALREHPDLAAAVEQRAGQQLVWMERS